MKKAIIIISIILSILLAILIIFLILRKLKIKNIKKLETVKVFSRAYNNILRLNKQYTFYNVKENHNFYVTLDSLQKLQQFDIYNYAINKIEKNFLSLYFKVSHNIKYYQEYQQKYNYINMSENYLNQNEISCFKNINMSFKSFNRIEEELCNSIKLDQPTTNLTFFCTANYTSPAGRNEYNKHITIKYKYLKKYSQRKK